MGRACEPLINKGTVRLWWTVLMSLELSWMPFISLYEHVIVQSCCNHIPHTYLSHNWKFVSFDLPPQHTCLLFIYLQSSNKTWVSFGASSTILALKEYLTHLKFYFKIRKNNKALCFLQRKVLSLSTLLPSRMSNYLPSLHFSPTRFPAPVHTVKSLPLPTHHNPPPRLLPRQHSYPPPHILSLEIVSVLTLSFSSNHNSVISSKMI